MVFLMFPAYVIDPLLSITAFFMPFNKALPYLRLS